MLYAEWRARAGPITLLLFEGRGTREPSDVRIALCRLELHALGIAKTLKQ